MRRTIRIHGRRVCCSTTAVVDTCRGADNVHVVWPADTTRVQFLDFGRDGLRLGDRLAARGPLLDATQTNKVGTGHLDCVVAFRITDGPPGPAGVYRCTYLLDLTAGDFVLEGLDPHGPGVFTMAVLGGTGAYAASSGDATITDTEAGTDFMIDLR